MRRIAAAVFLCTSLVTHVARAQTDEVAVDRVVVRFYAPETGGAARPSFVTERQLSFEANLERRIEAEGGKVESRHVRAALDNHIAAELLAALKLDKPIVPDERRRMRAAVRRALVERVGGDDVVTKLAEDEHLSSDEVDQFFVRLGDAAIYIDRAITPMLTPNEDQLREVYRTAAHPFRDKTFFQAREGLSRWFVAERLRVALGAYLQGARTRVKIQVLGT